MRFISYLSKIPLRVKALVIIFIAAACLLLGCGEASPSPVNGSTAVKVFGEIANNLANNAPCKLPC